MAGTVCSPIRSTRRPSRVRRGPARPARSTQVTGTASSCSPQRTTATRVVASVSGTRSVTVVPCPVLRSVTSPPSCRACVRTTSSPTPRPDRSVTCSRELNPGVNSSSVSAASSGLLSGPLSGRAASRGAPSGRVTPRRAAESRTAAKFTPLPSSVTVTSTCPPAL